MTEDENAVSDTQMSTRDIHVETMAATSGEEARAGDR
jgi:hypothetical protein